jgi:hypothetical protein
MRANGCELSGRGSFRHKALQEPATPLSLASDPASPVRSSELLACINTFVAPRRSMSLTKEISCQILQASVNCEVDVID